MLDQAFEELKKYDWGTDLNLLAPIDQAVATSYGKGNERQDLESRLITALSGPLSRDAQDYVCRKLAIVGSDKCVPALKGLLQNKGNSHMARFALERIQSAEAAKALRDSLADAQGEIKIGIIGSLGARGDVESVSQLAQLVSAADLAIARAAILALGAIGTTSASEAIKTGLQAAGVNLPYSIDAMFRCAETLLANQKRNDAEAIYQQMAKESQPRYVRLAATRGILACRSKQA